MPVEFDVVSIRPNSTPNGLNGGRTLPDGTTTMTGLPIAAIITNASPVETREVIGLPEWAKSDRFDVTVKPPPRSSADERKQMWRAMFADRMKLVAHVEQRERDVYLLVMARTDGKLGPQLKPSTLDCSPRPVTSGQAVPFADYRNRCGMAMSATSITSGGVAFDVLAHNLRGLTNGEVENHTGLSGFYAIDLAFSASRGFAALDANTAADDAPDIFTAVQEQLGLKLQREKRMTPVFVIDHIERPSEN
jgi:uncharacterized protein (TIGR03435 family)